MPGRIKRRDSPINSIMLTLTAPVSQMCAVTVSGLCFRGWMLYPTLVFGALQNITEPCLQAVMATFVGADRQGGLQVCFRFRQR